MPDAAGAWAAGMECSNDCAYLTWRVCSLIHCHSVCANPHPLTQCANNARVSDVVCRPQPAMAHKGPDPGAAAGDDIRGEQQAIVETAAEL